MVYSCTFFVCLYTNLTLQTQGTLGNFNMKYIITNANIVNEGRVFKGTVIIENCFIKEVIEGDKYISDLSDNEVIDADGKYLIPGIIDDHVHFREPGLTEKADIYTESKAAIAGGVTSYMEMPNTIPNAVTNQLLEEKYKIASEKSLANYSFYIGATNDNLKELTKLNNRNVCGIKVFMGASTGNMIVDDEKILEKIFSLPLSLIAVHCEDEKTINENLEKQKFHFGENIPVYKHPIIRSTEACFKSSSYAVSLATKYNTRLHLLHLTTSKEMELPFSSLPLELKRITSEVCISHLWFCDEDYKNKYNLIKCNPAIKTAADRDTLWNALIDCRIDVIATDHAPHTLTEKNSSYLKSPSGIPTIQYSLNAMLEFVHQKKISIEFIVKKMAHNPAICFGIAKRGFIRKGYYADLVLVDMKSQTTVNNSGIFSKCKWSPFEEYTFTSTITHTFINGQLVYNNGIFDESKKGMRLEFDRK